MLDARRDRTPERLTHKRKPQHTQESHTGDWHSKGEQLGARLERPAARIEKHLWVRRSDRSPTLYWWSMPLSPGALVQVLGDGLASARALVHPQSALTHCADTVRSQPLSSDVARVDDVPELLRALDEERAAACTVAVFPESRRDRELESAAPVLCEDLERLGFTLAIVPGGEAGARFRFCFRVPGKVLEAVEALALGRQFGGNLGQVEMALLQGLGLRPKQAARLRLVLEGGGASLQGIDRAGRRRMHYVETGKGYTGTYDEMSLREAVGERMRESWRRFPISVVMFAGLPFFIGAFWAKNLLSRRNTPGPR